MPKAREALCMSYPYHDSLVQKLIFIWTHKYQKIGQGNSADAMKILRDANEGELGYFHFIVAKVGDRNWVFAYYPLPHFVSALNQVILFTIISKEGKQSHFIVISIPSGTYSYSKPHKNVAPFWTKKRSPEGSSILLGQREAPGQSLNNSF